MALDNSTENGRTMKPGVRALQPEAAASHSAYERLGFRQVEDRGMYLFMEWQAESAAASTRSAASRES